MKIMYDLSELITDLFYLGTIDGPDVSYIAVGDHPTDVIQLEESLYNHIWSYWDYIQVLLQKGNPSGDASLSGVPDQPDEQHTNIQHVPVHHQGLLLLRCYKCLWEPALLAPLWYKHNKNNGEQVDKPQALM